jgi:hypothetical protein
LVPLHTGAVTKNFEIERKENSKVVKKKEGT